MEDVTLEIRDRHFSNTMGLLFNTMDTDAARYYQRLVWLDGILLVMLNVKDDEVTWNEL